MIRPNHGARMSGPATAMSPRGVAGRLSNYVSAALVALALVVPALAEDVPAAPEPVPTAKSPGVRDPIRAAQVQDEIRVMMTATYGGDAATVLKFMHASVIDAMGGKAKAQEEVGAALEQLKRLAITVEELDFRTSRGSFGQRANLRRRADAAGRRRGHPTDSARATSSAAPRRQASRSISPAGSIVSRSHASAPTSARVTDARRIARQAAIWEPAPLTRSRAP